MGKLIISRANKKPLTKSQEAFNKITLRIEKLHKEIAKKQLQFDKALGIFSADIYPLRQKKLEQLRRVFGMLWEVYQSKQLSKPDQRILKTVLQEDLYEIFQLLPDEPDEEWKNIFQELEGETYDNVLKREKSEIKEDMQEIFEKMNLDIDLNDVEEEADMAQKIAEAGQKLLEQQKRKAQQRQQHKKKTARQIEKEQLQEAADALKQKNISTIYRQLAKLFHPDLEHDEERKAEKETLMKQLTVAYESKNLHELLLLELRWIHKENTHLESLTEEKLAVYLQILREQAKELEAEKNTIFHQPRYRILVEEFGIFTGNPVMVVESEKNDLEEDIAALEDDAASFSSATALRSIRQMLKDAKAAAKQPTEEDLFNMLFGTDKRY